MKKVFIFLALPLLFMAESCSKFVEGYGESPNNPSTSTAPLLLSSTELGLFSTYTGTLSRASAILTQQCGGTYSQMLEIDQYYLIASSNTNDWNNLYNNVIQPATDLIVNFGHKDTLHTGVARIMKAMAFGIATDIWGDVPAREAGYGNINGNLTPKFNTQEDVIVYVQELLDSAIATLSTTEGENLHDLSSNDLIFGGDVDKWINTAYLLKARYANRLSKKDAAASATAALEYLSHVTDKGDAYAVYGTKTSEINQWYAFNVARGGYLKVGDYMVKLLQANNDPRLPFYAAKDEEGNYVGAEPSSENTDASDVGNYLAGIASPIPMATYTEALFIAAEANLRLGKTAEAATAYNAAVLRGVTNVIGGAPDAAFVAAYASATAATITLEQIMTQKYLYTFGQIEAWADWRRTGLPVIPPNENNVTDKIAIPRRFPTVQDEVLYNKANVVNVTDIFEPVWWDKN